MSTYDYALPYFLGYLLISFPIITLNFALRGISKAFTSDM